MSSLRPVIVVLTCSCSLALFGGACVAASPPPPSAGEGEEAVEGPGDPVAPSEPACTRDAKICPDGSAVGRTGPACEFAPCPEDGEDESPAGSRPIPPGQACTKEAKVCPDGSTVGRSGPACAFAPCPGEPGGSAPLGEPPRPGGSCQNLCGNGICEEVVCMAVGCPCAETKASCPADCP